MLQNIKKRTEGFTIIEVLIVLAIAGLIMLIVFLAVPALQRNSANNGRRSEASRVATAANDFVTNSNGTNPVASADGTGDAKDIKDAVGTTKYITKVSVVTTAQNTGVTATDTARIVVGFKCNGVKADTVSANSMAVQYGLEPATSACINV